MNDRRRLQTPQSPLDIGSPLGWHRVANWLLFEVAGEYLEQHLGDYFSADLSGKNLFQGQHFDWLVARSDATRFSADDVVAVTALSYTIPANAVREILDQAVSDQLHIKSPNDLLTSCRQVIDVFGSEDIRTCPMEWLDSPESPFVLLYNRLMSIHGVGKVAASKLMATKFPMLIPIWDDKVAGLLYDGNEQGWWVPMRELLTSRDGAVSNLLETLDLRRDDVVVGLLRRLDVVLWMEASVRKVSFKKLSSHRR